MIHNCHREVANGVWSFAMCTLRLLCYPYKVYYFFYTKKQIGMKASIFIASLLSFSLCAIAVSSQENNSIHISNFSLDVGGGYHFPVLPNEGIVVSDYNGFGSVYVGVNYALSNAWGVRLSYGGNLFEDKGNKSNTITQHRLMAEGTFNMLPPNQSRSNYFQLQAHGGAGISAGVSKFTSDVDKMTSFLVGIMPIYHFTKHISLLLDGSYVHSIKQNRGYSGGYVYEDVKNLTGGYFMVNVGVGYRF
ncbi:MAG: hypothetical protein PHN55_06540 [Dysgonamonadaceae bacterium]|nr:hypothetical protein [Dysgonamonadaceae bacterium]